MNNRWKSSLALALFLYAPNANSAQPAELHSMMHSLLQVQDRIADGDAEALPLQKHLMKLLDSGIEESGSINRMSQDDFRAVLTFAIIGVGSNVVVEVLREVPSTDKRYDISRAVIDYRQRKRNQAIKRFAALEDVELDARLLPIVAFAKGNLLGAKNPTQAIVQYNLTRLTAPGTLLEEATLRRLLALYSAQKNGRKFMVIAKQYSRRFLNSPYRQQYLAAVRRGIITMRRTIPTDEVGKLAMLMPPSHAAALYTHILRNSLLSGQLKLAGYSVSKLVELADAHQEIQVDSYQIEFLKLLSEISSEQPRVLLEKLRKIESERLQSEDRKLLSTAIDLLESIVAPLDDTITSSIDLIDKKKSMQSAQAANEVSSSPMRAASEKLEEQDAEIAEFLSTSQERLKAIDTLLNE